MPALMHPEPTDLQTRYEELLQESQRQQVQIAELRRAHLQEIQQIRGAEARARAELAAVYENSLSWRLTGWLRVAATRHGLARRLRELVRRPRMRRVAEGVAQATPPAALGTRDAVRMLQRARLETFLGGSGRLRLPASPAPEVSIILVLYNQAELTLACLESIAACLGDRGVAAEVIIVDNASQDATPDLLNRLSGACVIPNQTNLHFLRAVNLAAKEARGRHLLLLNNDAELLPGSLEAALATLGSAPDIGAVGARIVLPDGRLQEAGSFIANDGNPQGYMRGASPTVPEAMFRRDVDYCSGAFLLTPRAAWERLGGFDERYAPAYFEETDYCLRLWEQGLRVVYEPDAVILHFEFGSSGASSAIALQQRNAQIFRERHAAWIAGRPAPGQHQALALRSARRARRRVLMLEDRVPHAALGSGFPRAGDLLRALVRAGAEVSLLPMNGMPETWPQVRESVPPQVEVLLDRNRDELARLLAERRGHYDVLLACRPHNMQALRAVLDAEPGLAAGATVVYDAEAIFAVREVQQRRLAGEAVSEREELKLINAETTLAKTADLVITVNADEAELLRSNGVGRVHVLGHAVEPRPTPAPFEERRGFLFVGAMHEDRSPNADSLRWFASEILPLIRRELGGDIRLLVAGICNAPSILAMNGAELDLLGQVPDLAILAGSVRVMVAPTRFAAGIPHKLHQAAALGVPMVATDLLARQTGWQSGRDLLTGSTAEGFAAACIRLHEDPVLWASLRREALARCAEDCAPAVFDRAVLDILEACGRQGN